METADTTLPFLTLGAAPASVGDRVVAIGSPRGYESTVSEGIVSARRTLAGVPLLQTTAAISPGSSGGPLLNMAAEVVGVVVLKQTDAESINFAVSGERLRSLRLWREPAPMKEVSTGCRTPTSSRGATGYPGPSTVEGVYVGIWRSTKYGIQGEAALALDGPGPQVSGILQVTNSPSGYTGDEMVGEVQQMAAGVWSAQLRSVGNTLEVKAIFRNGTMTGDYKFRHGFLGLGLDEGQWILEYYGPIDSGK